MNQISSSLSGKEVVVTKESDQTTSMSEPVMIGILLTEAMASFAFYGSQVILVLYLRQSLGFTEASSVALFSFVSSMSDLSPLLGAILADGWLGRYKTILCFGGVATVGMIITAIGAFANGPQSTIILDDGIKPNNDHSSIGVPSALRNYISFVGLVLLFGGERCIDPCLSSFGADQVGAESPSSQTDLEIEHGDKPTNNNEQQSEQQQVRVQSFFASFYFCMNIGALGSYGLIPWVREYEGFGTAFLVCGLSMLIGLGCLMSKRRQYTYSVTSSVKKDSSMIASTFSLAGRIFRKRFLRACRQWTSRTLSDTSRTSERKEASDLKADSHADRECLPLLDEWDTSCYGSCEAANDADATLVRDVEQALRVAPIMAMLPVFWMLYDQQESIWILQASRMSLHGLQPEQMCLVNPIQVSIFIPLFDQYVYPSLARHGWKLDHLTRMGIGMILAAASYIVSGALEVAMQHAEAHGSAPPSVFWQLIQITVKALSEIFVYVTGLEFAYSSAPPRLKAFLVATFSMTKAVGNMFAGLLYSTIFQGWSRATYSTIFQGWSRATVIFVCASIMLINLALFHKVAKWYRSTKAPMKKINETTT